MLYLIALIKTVPLNVLGAMDYLWDIDGLVTRLLSRLTRTTRVLVLAQTRQRPNTRTEYNVKYDINNLFNTEWRDSLLMAHIRKRTTVPENVNENVENVLTNLLNNYYGKNRKLKTQNAATEKTKKIIKQFGERLYNEFLITMKNQNKTLIKTNSTKYDEFEDEDSFDHKRKAGNVRSNRFLMKFDQNIWFWDTSLPLNLASIRECNHMFYHDPETVLLLPSTLRYKMRIMKYASMLESIGVDPDKYLSPKSNIGNVTLQSDMQATSTKTESAKAEAKYPQENSEMKLQNEAYFADFSNAYISSRLNCLDDMHAGTATTQVEVTQLLNMICNDVLSSNTKREYCCQ